MDVTALLRRHGIRPSKGLGQNFLTDEHVFERIVQASELAPDDTVLEVGPGLGLLTRRLAERVAHVVAVELDRKMLAVLDETLGSDPRVHLIQADILEVDPIQEMVQALGLPGAEGLRFKVVANLPYYITSAVLRHLLGQPVRPTLMTLMVQREVAQRIVAGPGKMSLLAVSVQVFGEPEIVAKVPAGAFYPPPKVESAVLRVRVFPEPRVPEADLGRFFKVVRAGFGQKRKQLHNSLTHGLPAPREQVLAALQASDVAPERRAETLSIDEWVALTRALLPDDA